MNKILEGAKVVGKSMMASLGAAMASAALALLANEGLGSVGGNHVKSLLCVASGVVIYPLCRKQLGKWMKLEA